MKTKIKTPHKSEGCIVGAHPNSPALSPVISCPLPCSVVVFTTLPVILIVSQSHSRCFVVPPPPLSSSSSSSPRPPVVVVVPPLSSSSPCHHRCPPVVIVVPPSSSLSPCPPHRRRRAPALCRHRPVVSPPIVGGGHRRCRRCRHCRCVLGTAVSCYHPATPRAKARSGGGGGPSPSLSIKKLPRCFFC